MLTFNEYKEILQRDYNIFYREFEGHYSQQYFFFEHLESKDMTKATRLTKDLKVSENMKLLLAYTFHSQLSRGKK